MIFTFVLRIPPVVRLVIALVLTAGALPYTYDRVLVRWMMGTIDWLMLILFVPSLMATMLVTQNLAAGLSTDGIRRLMLPVLILAWVIEHAVLVAMSVGGPSPRLALTLVLSASTLWIPWAAWFRYGLLPTRVTAGVLALLLLLAPAFPLLFTVRGMMGDTTMFFSWRWKTAPRHEDAADSIGPTHVILHGLKAQAVAPAGAALGGLAHQLADLGLMSTNPFALAGGTADLTKTTPHDFPQYLGPDRRAVLPKLRLARDWTAHPPREVWRRSVGEGWGSFAVVGEYAVTQEQRGMLECVTCYRLSDGARVWIHSDLGRYESSMRVGDGPRATPTVVDGRVYTVGALGQLNCLDGATGKPIWSRNMLADVGGSVIEHGVCASPLVVDDLVLVCPTGKEGASLAAYQRDTGNLVWYGGENMGSYASPLLAELGGVRQVLVHNSGGVAGHEIATGKVLWSFPLTNGYGINCGMPIVEPLKPGQVFASTGYNTGSVLWDLESGEPVWQSKQMKAKFTTVVAHQGYAYGLDDGYLACIDLKTGRSKWKDRRFRYKHGQVLLVGDLLLVQAEEGEVCLVEANPEELRELGSFPALVREGEKTWNNPALAGRFLLVRNAREAACYELALEEK